MTAAAINEGPKLIDYLPAIYHEDPFLGRFLNAFERILLGGADSVIVAEPGLEEEIGAIPALFDPLQTPADFIPWLAGWTAFILRADIDENTQRQFLADIISLYRHRGTKQNLIKLLGIFTRGVAIVEEEGAVEFQIGVNSTIGVDTYLAGGRPYTFNVIINFARSSGLETERQIAIARSLIELEKPAHTTYTLDAKFPTMQIGVYSRVGVDTILGTISD